MAVIRALVCLVLACVFFTSGQAAEPQNNNDAELDALMQMLEQQTEIATKTGLNKDFVPGLVSLLDGRDMERRGMRTVAEALTLVPGLNITSNGHGASQILVRGMTPAFASSTVKVMLNGISLSSPVLRGNAAFLEVPISQVERIEIVRGPGSAVHGEFALMGIVNIITRNQGKRLSGEIDEAATWSGGGVYSWQSEDRDWDFALNAAAAAHRGGDLDAQSDALYQFGLGAFSNAPGPANSKKHYRSILFNADSDDYSFKAQWLQLGAGDFFGINEYLPPDSQKIISTNDYFNLQGERHLQSSELGELDVRFGWTRINRDVDKRYVGPPELFGGPPGDDIVADVDLVEDHTYAEFDLRRRYGDHGLLLSGGVAYTDVAKSRLLINLDPASFLPTVQKNAFFPVVEKDDDRWNYHLLAQDEWRIDDRLSLTYGARFDDYDDVGSAFTPRLAAVYRASRDLTLKAQYAHAFRPPTLYEIGGSLEDLEPVESDNFEIAVIYGQQGNRVAVTLFHHDIRDLIVFNFTPTGAGYLNLDGAHSSGVEIEAERRLNRFVSIDGNISYTRPRDESVDEDIMDSTRWLANAGVRFTPTHDLSFHLQANYVGERVRAWYDPRDPIDDSITVDVSADWQAAPDLIVRSGVRNVGDVDRTYPARALTYADDFPTQGRTFWLGLIYQPGI